MTTDWIRPAMPEPKGLDFGKLPQKPESAKPKAGEPNGINFGAAPHLPQPHRSPEPQGIPLYEIGRGLVGHVDPNPPRPAPRRQGPPVTPILGGDPRAPALVEKARGVNAALADHRLFRNRLEAFLDLRPSAWATWGDADLGVLTTAASRQAEFSRKLSLANAVRWCEECEQAYKKPPGLLDRLTAPKPEFYRERLEQARDVLVDLGNDVDTLLRDLRPRLENVTIDAFVLQIATTDVTAQADQITANRRLQTMVAGQQTAEMILQGLDALGGTVANQRATIGDLLTVTIPNWIIARSKA
jgi:hypothetical protein